ncbi:MAG TPA: M28 family peptidase [Allosphingosinicella sp.]
MRGRHFGLALIFAASLPAIAATQPKPADHPPLITTAEAQALAAELSGSTAKRTIEQISANHRMRGSRGYAAAAELIRARLAEAGLGEVEIISLPADGRIFYGTQRSRPGWNAERAELWERRQEGGRWVDGDRIASWAEEPLVLAQDSVSGRADADLVDVGAGTAESDYAGKDVKGKLVLVSAQPGEAAPLAIGKYRAAGLVSWAQNQKQAWWGEDDSLIRWGHLDTWENPTFAFMVSPARARAWKSRLAAGETVRLRADVEAGRGASAYLIPTAVIPGKDRTREIVFSCHLDHPNPGANDNASGCAGILEIARGLTALIKAGKLPEPKRSIRFIWPAEIEATIALLNARPIIAAGTLATLHLDMIGGRTETTGGTLTVEGSPPSSPSFVGDVGFAIARWANAQTADYQDRGASAFPLTEPEGGKRALQANVGGFSEGSDHQIWAEGSWRIPILYVSDWPDRYIHTSKDVPANIDPTKLKRAMFIAAASAWYLANLDDSGAEPLRQAMRAETLDRWAERQRQAAALRAGGASEGEVENLARHQNWYERTVGASLARFNLPPVETDAAPAAAAPAAAADPAFAIVYRRVEKLKGPMSGFGYSWFDDRLKKAKLPRPALLGRDPIWDGPSFGYETLNLVDGKRSVQAIRDDLAATVGPAPAAEVAEYLAVLERLGAIERSPK